MLTYLRKPVKYASSSDQERLSIGKIQIGVMAKNLGSEVRMWTGWIESQATPLSAISVICQGLSFLIYKISMAAVEKGRLV